MFIRIRGNLPIYSRLAKAINLKFSYFLIIFFSIALLYGNYCYSAEKSLTIKAEENLRIWATALDMFAMDYERFPETQDIKNLANLIKEGSYWFGPIITDPWNNLYHYKSDGQSYQIWSTGPDAQSGTEDDIKISKSLHGGGAA